MIDITLVVPCYNEGQIFDNNVKELYELLRLIRFNFEIILIDDCSKDDTPKNAEKLAKEFKEIKFLAHKINLGRGGTVAEGIRIAKGSMVGFIDIDLEIPASAVLACVREIIKGSDVVCAKRMLHYKLRYFHRYILSRGYNLLFRILFKTSLTDTEAGCKFFKKAKILPVLDKVKDGEWFWDTEIMVKAFYSGLKIKEVPVPFIKNKQKRSTVILFPTIKNYLVNLIRLHKELKGLKSVKA